MSLVPLSIVFHFTVSQFFLGCVFFVLYKACSVWLDLGFLTVPLGSSAVGFWDPVNYWRTTCPSTSRNPRGDTRCLAIVSFSSLPLFLVYNLAAPVSSIAVYRFIACIALQFVWSFWWSDHLRRGSSFGEKFGGCGGFFVPSTSLRSSRSPPHCETLLVACLLWLRMSHGLILRFGIFLCSPWACLAAFNLVSFICSTVISFLQVLPIFILLRCAFC